MPDRIRVLHVIQNLNYGGMERVLSDIVLRCDRTRFESHVLCLQYLGRFASGLDEVATLHLAKPMTAASMLRPHSLAHQIRAIEPHVVHSHSGVWYKASYAARLARVPLVVHTEHGRASPDPLRDRLVDAIGARRTDVVVAVSDLLAQQLMRTLSIPSRKLAVIPNGVDVDGYAPHADTGRLRRELGIPLSTPIIGSIGRLEPIKGYDVMIDAFAVLRERGQDRGAMLVIGGEGTERAALEQRVRDRGLTSGVRMLGWRDDVLDLHSSFTLFTMSSRSEGTSISLLEAMSAGLPPVVTAVGGNGAVLGEPLAHRLVPSENPAALASCWAELLGSPEVRAREASAARHRVINAFGLEAMVRSYERAYLRAAPRGASGSQARSSA
jgi:glycosyltransferase involved in cell wall biosynthesis